MSLAREFGPALGTIGVLVLAGGTLFAALVVFLPVRRRLKAFQDAVARLGAGDTTARASVDGADEISELALAFNRMAADLDARTRALETADRTRRQLLADVSHELMTPLTAIRGYVETLAMPHLSLEADVRARYLGVVEQEAQRLERLIGDLLDLARFEAGGVTLAVQDVPAVALFDRVLARHERDCRDRHVTMTQTIGQGAEVVRGDPDRLGQALQNLAANALRHTPPNGRVDLVSAVDDGAIVLSVRDTGAGIPAEHLPYVFDRFYKADAARGGGSGLGLSIVRAVAHRHGGTVRVQSQIGVGTVFEIRLPKTSSDH
jgi:two-component system sensor histidine kinase BaeS